MSDYEDLDVYKKAMELSSETWNVVRTWPYFHKDTLGKQIVRSSDSIPSNIAEGYGRYTFKERIRFCHVARGSLYEYNTQLQIARRRGLLDDSAHAALAEFVERIGQLLNGFIRHLRRQGLLEKSNRGQRGFTVEEPNTEYRIPNTEYRVPNTEYRISSTEYRIPNTE